MIENFEEVVKEIRNRIERTERMAGIMPVPWLPIKKKQTRKKRVAKVVKGSDA